MSIVKPTHFIALLLLVFVAGCSEPASSENNSSDAATKVSATPINANCPITGNKVVPDVTALWNDKTIGFCCAGCIPMWDALSDEEKQNKLDAAEAGKAAGSGHREHNHPEEMTHDAK